MDRLMRLSAQLRKPSKKGDRKIKASTGSTPTTAFVVVNGISVAKARGLTTPRRTEPRSYGKGAAVGYAIGIKKEHGFIDTAWYYTPGAADKAWADAFAEYPNHVFRFTVRAKSFARLNIDVDFYAPYAASDRDYDD